LCAAALKGLFDAPLRAPIGVCRATRCIKNAELHNVSGITTSSQE
jgi:hypothetical protein